jgi:hypothetical protein
VHHDATADALPPSAADVSAYLSMSLCHPARGEDADCFRQLLAVLAVEIEKGPRHPPRVARERHRVAENGAVVDGGKPLWIRMESSYAGISAAESPT